MKTRRLAMWLPIGIKGLTWQKKAKRMAGSKPAWRNTAHNLFSRLSPFLNNFFRWWVRQFILRIYRPKVEGLENIPKHGPLILIANHVSFLDGLIITALVPRKVRFVIYKGIYELPLVNFFMRINRAIPIFPKREHVEKALDDISEGLKGGDCICIFPEGQITYTGHLGRFKPGIEFIFQRDPVTVVPIGINGLWGSVFSRKYIRSARRWIPRHWGIRPKVVIGWQIAPEKVNVEKLQRITLKLLERAAKL
ncbi:hypothetical protein GC177_06975 [bacterium]|nr:hypothetical protein [bacterium]